MKNKNLIVMVSILAVVICLIMTALLFFAVNPTFLIILSNCVGIVTGVFITLLIHNLTNMIKAKRINNKEENLLWKIGQKANWVMAIKNRNIDPSSIHSITASFLEHCRMNGFGMTYCFGSKGRKEETAVCPWKIQSSYF